MGPSDSSSHAYTGAHASAHVYAHVYAQAERQFLALSHLNTIRPKKGDSIRFGSEVFSDSDRLLPKAIEAGAIKTMFPLHRPTTLHGACARVSLCTSPRTRPSTHAFSYAHAQTRARWSLSTQAAARHQYPALAAHDASLQCDILVSVARQQLSMRLFVAYEFAWHASRGNILVICGAAPQQDASTAA